MHSYTRYDGFVVMSEKDNVAVALEDMQAGKKIQLGGQDLELKENIDFGHKFATRKISKGENIIKYGEIIGVAGMDIEPGQHVHVHNVESLRGGKNHRA